MATHLRQPGPGVGAALRALAVTAVVGTALAGLSPAHATADPAKWTVRSGDSLWAIARATSTTVDGLRRANGITGSLIHTGDVLLLSGARSTSTTPAALPSPSSSIGKRYVIRAGDSLWAISRRHHVALDSLMAANGLQLKSLIHPGQVLAIPGTAPTPAGKPAPPPATAIPQPAAVGDGLSMAAAVARNRATLASLPAPSQEQARATVTSVAKRHGVDPVLALAIAYNESRHQQNVVSYANAIGTMQVLPSTGRWIADTMAGRPLNLLRLEDNVTAGVLFMKFLLDRVPRELAIGAYFQGLDGVQRTGMSPATREYVARVHGYEARFR